MSGGSGPKPSGLDPSRSEDNSVTRFLDRLGNPLIDLNYRVRLGPRRRVKTYME